MEDNNKQTKNYMSAATRLYKCDGNLGEAMACNGVRM